MDTRRKSTETSKGEGTEKMGKIQSSRLLKGKSCELWKTDRRTDHERVSAELEKTAAGLASRRTLREFPEDGSCFLCEVGVAAS